MTVVSAATCCATGARRRTGRGATQGFRGCSKGRARSPGRAESRWCWPPETWTCTAPTADRRRCRTIVWRAWWTAVRGTGIVCRAGQGAGTGWNARPVPWGDSSVVGASNRRCSGGRQLQLSEKRQESHSFSGTEKQPQSLITKSTKINLEETTRQKWIPVEENNNNKNSGNYLIVEKQWNQVNSDPLILWLQTVIRKYRGK